MSLNLTQNTTVSPDLFRASASYFGRSVWKESTAPEQVRGDWMALGMVTA
jgi:hypothetical protein